VGLPFVVGSDYVVWDRRAQLRERKMWSGTASEGRGRGDAASTELQELLSTLMNRVSEQRLTELEQRIRDSYNARF
jgi:hypothetical protein